jgi:uncharacterized phage protein gp47/JayE
MAGEGLTDAGFVPKITDTIRTELNQVVFDIWGNAMNVSDKYPMGQLLSIIAEREAALWEGLQAAHAALDPDAATATALANLCALSGTLREAATPSVVTLHHTGTVSTLIGVGEQVSVDSTGEVFQTTTSATLATATAWLTSTAYVVGDIRSNDTNIYICITAGTSSGGPTGESTPISDGGASWRFIGDGLAFATATADSVNTGPIAGNAFAITTRETVVSGWEGTHNLTDAAQGTNLETDEALRIRRELELTRAGSSPKDALRVDILDVTDVTAVTVFENTSDTTDGDGVPPHSVEILVRDGAAQDIRDAILASKGAATGTFGGVSGTADDSQGTAVPIDFSRPTEIDIYVDIVLDYDVDLYPTDGDTQVKAAIAAYGDLQATGKDVVSSSLKGAIFAAVLGILDVSLAEISTSASPTVETTIPISLRELAIHDTSRITVASSVAVP